MGNGKYHRLGRTVLITMPIYFQSKPKILRIRDFVARDEPWSDRPKGIHAFPFNPLSGALQQERSFG